MPQKMYIDKSQLIMHIWFFFIIVPIIIGTIIGYITAKVKPSSLRLTLIISLLLSLAFFSISLLTLHKQALPQLALIITVTSTLIMNISAIVSNKLINLNIRIK